jgi:hypothetical protein
MLKTIILPRQARDKHSKTFFETIVTAGPSRHPAAAISSASRIGRLRRATAWACLVRTTTTPFPCCSLIQPPATSASRTGPVLAAGNVLFLELCWTAVYCVFSCFLFCSGWTPSQSSYFNTISQFLSSISAGKLVLPFMARQGNRKAFEHGVC